MNSQKTWGKYELRRWVCFLGTRNARHRVGVWPDGVECLIGTELHMHHFLMYYKEKNNMLIKLKGNVGSSTLEEVWVRNLHVAMAEENG